MVSWKEVAEQRNDVTVCLFDREPLILLSITVNSRLRAAFVTSSQFSTPCYRLLNTMHSLPASNVSVSAQKICEKNSPAEPKQPTVNSFSSNTLFSAPPFAQMPRTDFCPDAASERMAGGLGNITKSCDPFKNHGLTDEVFLQVDSESGEAKVYRQGRNGTCREQIDRSQARLEKWELLDCAQSILTGSRTRYCLRNCLEHQVAIVQSKSSFRCAGLLDQGRPL